MRKHFSLGTLGIFSLILAFSGIAFAVPAQAAATPLFGWAWSSNIGWISFNSTDQGASGGHSYNVSVDPMTGDFSGYAWSPNVGWISFDSSDLTASPACSNPTPANLNASTGQVSGYARVISFENADNGGNAGDDDGCFKLSDNSSSFFSSPDSNGNGGVTYYLNTAQTQGLFRGNAWDNRALGWLNFNPQTNVQVNCPGCTTPPACTGGSCSRPGLGGGPGPGPGGGGGPGGDGISVQCNASPVNSNPVVLQGPGTVTYIAAASGGSGSYQYSWDGGLNYGSASSYVTPQYSSSGPGPILYIKDTNTPADTASTSCANVVVEGAATSDVKLMIGNTVNALPENDFTKSDYAALRITQGTPFQLAWNLNLSSDYTCTPSGPSNWSSTWGNEVVNTTANHGDLSGLSTVSVPTGDYQFTLMCSNSISGDIQQSSVNLFILSKAEGEF